MLYKPVAGRGGLKVGGLNTPDHVLRRLTIEYKRVFVDNVRGGKLHSVPNLASVVSKWLIVENNPVLPWLKSLRTG